MLHVNFASIVDLCLHRAWAIILASALIVAGSSVYVARHFAVDSSITHLLAPNLPWRQRELAYQAAFTPSSTRKLTLLLTSSSVRIVLLTVMSPSAPGAYCRIT
jgi:hypothetical protein